MNFPQSAYYGRRVPKKAFIEKLALDSPVRRSMTEDIERIEWTWSLKEATLHLPRGREVEEIEVFTVRLKRATFDERMLFAFDRQIPYHLLYLMEHDGKQQAWIGYKEAAAANEAFRVGQYYHTAWMDADALPLAIEGVTLDDVYEHFVRQVAGTALRQRTPDETLKASVKTSERIAALDKQIADIAKRLKKEKQFNRKITLHSEKKRLEQEREALLHG
ncbi:MAG: DUF4391 domain-containing protein [Selenomonas sp.]|uniref:DUF4391 domain-containing protein n=1 Tax=Selenomonas sp. TaxID=2053611 RepID=UPI0025F7CF1F|nr:DUF4391 domain-containing protein [Selenomonas sp.]MCI6086065.1 DUF4391 domain-containing protein [Selenomonas sp.]